MEKKKSKSKINIIIPIILVVVIIAIVLVFILNNQKENGDNKISNSKKIEFYSENPNIPTLNSVCEDVSLYGNPEENNDFIVYSYVLNTTDTDTALNILTTYLTTINTNIFYVEGLDDIDSRKLKNSLTIDIKNKSDSSVAATYSMANTKDEGFFSVIAIWTKKIK